jgi:hypothetical protein
VSMASAKGRVVAHLEVQQRRALWKNRSMHRLTEGWLSGEYVPHLAPLLAGDRGRRGRRATANVVLTVEGNFEGRWRARRTGRVRRPGCLRFRLKDRNRISLDQIPRESADAMDELTRPRCLESADTCGRWQAGAGRSGFRGRLHDARRPRPLSWAM